MRSARRAWVTLAALAVLPAANARAEERAPPDVRGYFEAGGGVGLPHGDFAQRAARAAPAWSFQFGLGPKGIPLTLGLGAGGLTTASRSYAGPTGTWIHDGVVDFGPTTVTHSTELRHVELILRFEPDWIRVRPFLELTGGVAQLWSTTTMKANWTGGVLDDTEAAADWTPLFGLGAGVTVVPFRPWVVDGASFGLGLTLGVRASRGGAIDDPQPATPAGARTALAPARTPLELVVPYALLTLTLRTPDRARAAP